MYDFILVFYNNQAALGEVRIRNKQKKDISLYPTQEYLADAEIPGHASCYLPPKYKAPHFLYPTQPTGLSQKKIGITGCYNPGELLRAGSQDTDLSATCPFPLFDCDDNPPMLQTDGRTDGRHARNTNAKCQAIIAACIKTQQTRCSLSSRLASLESLS